MFNRPLGEADFSKHNHCGKMYVFHVFFPQGRASVRRMYRIISSRVWHKQNENIYRYKYAPK